jgi:hypothetical protein
MILACIAATRARSSKVACPRSRAGRDAKRLGLRERRSREPSEASRTVFRCSSPGGGVNFSSKIHGPGDVVSRRRFSVHSLAEPLRCWLLCSHCLRHLLKALGRLGSRDSLSPKDACGVFRDARGTPAASLEPCERALRAREQMTRDAERLSDHALHSRRFARSFQCLLRRGSPCGRSASPTASKRGGEAATRTSPFQSARMSADQLATECCWSRIPTG